LDETFAVYGRHFWRFVGLVAIVQAPINVLLLAVYLVTGGGATGAVASFLLGTLATVVVYGAVVSATGQQYLNGEIGIRKCYGRAMWRLISLILISIVMIAILSIVLVPMGLTDQPTLVMLASLASIPVLALAIYWSMAIQAAVVEGHKAVGALKRSFGLVRGSWWRVFGVSMVFGLVAFGLAIVVSVPFTLPLLLAEADLTTGVSIALRFLGNVAVQTVVPPVIFISGTLLYYDLRVRKEDYSLSTLSREMGIAGV